MRKGQSFITGQEGQEENSRCEVFEQMTQNGLMRILCHNQMMNTQNNRWISLSLQDVQMKTKHPVHIMVFGVVTRDGDVHLLHTQIGGPHQVPGGRSATLDRKGVWQQDSVPCHTSRRTQSWLREHFCDHITP